MRDLKKLSHGIGKLQMEVEVILQNKLLQHLELLEKWNRVHNLTAINKIQDMITLHTLDSLSISRYLKGTSFLDLGSGAGFPGIPLAIVNPEKKFVLVETNGKKCQFLQYVINELNLTNISVVQSRIEEFQVDELVDGILARALASIEWIYKNSKRFLKINGNLYLMLAKNIEISQDLTEYIRLISLEVPYLDAQRKLLIINKLNS